MACAYIHWLASSAAVLLGLYVTFFFSFAVQSKTSGIASSCCKDRHNPVLLINLLVGLIYLLIVPSSWSHSPYLSLMWPCLLIGTLVIMTSSCRLLGACTLASHFFFYKSWGKINISAVNKGTQWPRLLNNNHGNLLISNNLWDFPCPYHRFGNPVWAAWNRMEQPRKAHRKLCQILGQDAPE